MKRIVYKEIASTIVALINCQNAEVQDENRKEWTERHQETLRLIAAHCLPSGSGMDGGCIIDLDQSTDEKIVLTLSFYHMDEQGGYDGWTDHSAIIKASLWNDLDIRITGRDRNGIKEYLHELIGCALREEMTHKIVDGKPFISRARDCKSAHWLEQHAEA